MIDNNNDEKTIIIDESKNNTIDNLSYEVINELCTYLSSIDVLHLYITNNYFIKYKHCCYYYKFNQEYSLLYYNDNVFRNQVNSICNIKKNLSINLSCCDIDCINVLENINTIDISMTKVLDLSPLINSYKVDLSCSIEFDTKTMKSLSNIKIIDLSNCSHVNDISMLKDAEYIDISFTNVSDVSMLGLQKTLILSGCTNVHDVQNLGNVTHLDLSGCINIEDVSSLGKVHTLTLKNCDKVKDVRFVDYYYYYYYYYYY